MIYHRTEGEEAPRWGLVLFSYANSPAGRSLDVLSGVYLAWAGRRTGVRWNRVQWSTRTVLPVLWQWK